MGPAQSIKTGFAKSFQFSGRASRSEFWWFVAAVLVGLGAVALVEDTLLGQSHTAFAYHHGLNWLFVIAILAPLHAFAVRRLQDAGWPGWLAFAPPVVTPGCIAAMIAQYGPGPYNNLANLGSIIVWAVLMTLICPLLVIGLLCKSQNRTQIPRPNPSEALS